MGMLIAQIIGHTRSTLDQLLIMFPDRIPLTSL